MNFCCKEEGHHLDLTEEKRYQVVVTGYRMSGSCRQEVQCWSRADQEQVSVQKNVRTIAKGSGETSFRILCLAAILSTKKKFKNLNKCREGHNGNGGREKPFIWELGLKKLLFIPQLLLSFWFVFFFLMYNILNCILKWVFGSLKNINCFRIVALEKFVSAKNSGKIIVHSCNNNSTAETGKEISMARHTCSSTGSSTFSPCLLYMIFP